MKIFAITDTTGSRVFAIAILPLGLYTIGSIAVHNGCHAKKIDSHDLLIGDWETTVRLESQHGNHNNKLLEIFSTMGATITSTKNDIHYPQQNDERWNPLKQNENKRRPRQYEYSRNIPCRLSLYSNGTFDLVDRYCNDSSTVHSHHQHRCHNQQQRPKESSSFSIRGKWTLQTNPYCVTDRLYDDVLLESHPRVRNELLQLHNIRTVPNESISTNNIDSAMDDIQHRSVISSSSSVIQPVEKARLKLQCRLSGHFTANRRNSPPWWQRLYRHSKIDDHHYHSYARGKMTHGVMTLEELYNIHNRENDEDNPTILGTSSPIRYLRQLYRRQQRRPRRIVASFSARRYIPTYSDLISQSNHYDEYLDTF